MREIKFRGKRISNGKWLYGDLMHDTVGGCYIFPIDCAALYKEYAILPETIGQYTGLKDKNDKEIYEGDIVLTPFVDPIFGDMVGEDSCEKRQVKFNDGSFVVDEGDGFIYVECFTRNNHIEICGNIHDNPELLTK